MCAGGCVGDGEWQGNPILSTDRVLQDLIGILSAQVEPRQAKVEKPSYDTCLLTLAKVASCSRVGENCEEGFFPDSGLLSCTPRVVAICQSFQT